MRRLKLTDSISNEKEKSGLVAGEMELFIPELPYIKDLELRVSLRSLDADLYVIEGDVLRIQVAYPSRHSQLHTRRKQRPSVRTLEALSQVRVLVGGVLNPEAAFREPSLRLLWCGIQDPAGQQHADTDQHDNEHAEHDDDVREISVADAELRALGLSFLTPDEPFSRNDCAQYHGACMLHKVAIYYVIGVVLYYIYMYMYVGCMWCS